MSDEALPSGLGVVATVFVSASAEWNGCAIRLPLTRQRCLRYTVNLQTEEVSYERARLTDKWGVSYAPGSGLPRINYERFNGHRACYTYAIVGGFAGGSEHYASQALIKTDMCSTDTPLVVWRKEGHYISEPVFAGRPGGIDEDDVPFGTRPHAAARLQTRVAPQKAAAHCSDSTEGCCSMQRLQLAWVCLSGSEPHIWQGVLLSAVLDGARARSYVLVLDAKTMREVARVDTPEGYAVPYSIHGQFYAA